MSGSGVLSGSGLLSDSDVDGVADVSVCSDSFAGDSCLVLVFGLGLGLGCGADGSSESTWGATRSAVGAAEKVDAVVTGGAGGAGPPTS